MAEQPAKVMRVASMIGLLDRGAPVSVVRAARALRQQQLGAGRAGQRAAPDLAAGASSSPVSTDAAGGIDAEAAGRDPRLPHAAGDLRRSARHRGRRTAHETVRHRRLISRTATPPGSAPAPPST